MDRKQLQAVQEGIRYFFKRPELLRQAFTRKSYSNENPGVNHNEVLAFYGDKALELIVMRKLSEHFGKVETDFGFSSIKTAGQLTDIKKELVCGDNLAKYMDKLGYAKYLIMGNGDIQQNVVKEASVKEELFKAIVGAVAIDSAWNAEALDRVVSTMLDINATLGGRELVNSENNKRNRGYLIMDRKQLQELQEKLEYFFERPELLRQAFTRKSYSEENRGVNHNEVLEFYGDKALELIVMKKLSEHFGKIEDDRGFSSLKTEGELTDIKQKLVCKGMLADCIDDLGFAELLVMGNGDIQQNVVKEASVKEDLFEAIVGAVAIDSNWNVEILDRVINKMLDIDGLLGDPEFLDPLNYVNMLNEWCQKNCEGSLPEYVLEAYDDGFKCVVSLPDTKKQFDGVGASHKKARMAAAKKAYCDPELANKRVRPLMDEVGKPELERAINQLQELYQKGHIAEPGYLKVSIGYNANGAELWRCECSVDGYGSCSEVCSSAKAGKKKVAYDMLCNILGYNE